MLARSLRIAALLNIASAIFWFAFFWARHPCAAVIGSLAALVFFAPLLGILFVAVFSANRSDPAPPAQVAQSIRAWLTEVISVARVFFWRQAFFSTQMPDSADVKVASSGLPGVVFIHGFICNRGVWSDWLAQMARQRRAYVAVNLEPVLGSIDAYVAVIERAVNVVAAASGQPPILICHSMGGLAARAWLRAKPQNSQRVRHIITIGTPHHGTWLGKFAVSKNGRQMRIGSQWLKQLQQDEVPDAAKLFTCFYSNCDEIVFPASTAMLAGADNRLIAGVPHLALAFHPDVMNASLALF